MVTDLEVQLFLLGQDLVLLGLIWLLSFPDDIARNAGRAGTRGCGSPRRSCCPRLYHLSATEVEK